MEGAKWMEIQTDRQKGMSFAEIARKSTLTREQRKSTPCRKQSHLATMLFLELKGSLDGVLVERVDDAGYPLADEVLVTGSIFTSVVSGTCLTHTTISIKPPPI
jgi:hypothetical protein